MTDPKPRWQYRFDNFKRARALLHGAIEQYNNGKLDIVGKAGLIQFFELCMGLAWNTMKDYLKNHGTQFSVSAPAVVIREALAAGLITDGETWMSALEARNKMSHIYDLEESENILEAISADYIRCFDRLHKTLEEKI